MTSMLAAPPNFAERLFSHPMAGFALQQTEVVLCPRAKIGRVIGKNGETIKALQVRPGHVGARQGAASLCAQLLIDEKRYILAAT